MYWITLTVATRKGPVQLELSSLSTVRRVIMETLERFGYKEGDLATQSACLIDHTGKKLADSTLVYEIDDPTDLWLTKF